MRLSELRPGWRTDLVFGRVGMDITERDDCIVFRTPANPGFYWGNYLLLAEPPHDEDLDRWLAHFQSQITRVQPDSRHVALGINTVYAGQHLPAWEAAGLKMQVNAVMHMRPGALRAPPPAKAHEVIVRPIDWARELPAIIALEMADIHGFEPGAYRLYRQRQFERYAVLQRAGLAEWFGLWCDGELAADCGLLRDRAAPGALGRFQRVATHPQWRRRGLAGALVHAVTCHAFDRWQMGEVIMIADPEDVAIGIYRSLGYRELEREWLFQRRAPGDGTD